MLLVSINPFVHRLLTFTYDIALKTNTVKWEVSLLGVSKTIPKHLGKSGLLFRSSNIYFRQKYF